MGRGGRRKPAGRIGARSGRGGRGGGVGPAAFVEHGGGDGFEIPDGAREGKSSQSLECGMDRPPEEAAVGGGLVAVVVVEPAVAERKDGDDDAVAGAVVGGVTAAADEAGEGIDGGGAVRDHEGADDEAAGEELRAVGADGGGGGCKRGAGGGEGAAKEERNDLVEAVPPDERGESREVGDDGVVGGLGARARDPEEVRPPEAVAAGRVRIDFLVGVAVVMAVPAGRRRSERRARS